MTATTAPGKVLWAGEYAVLDGAPAVVTAVTRRVRAIVGAADAHRSPFLEAARVEVAARFGDRSAAAVAARRVVVDSDALAQGGRKLGLGSSAAATVAAVAAAIADTVTPDELRPLVHHLAHRAHGAAQVRRGARGSGADVAASTWGGVLRVARTADDDLEPLAVERLPWPAGLDAALVWTGVPADTPTLVARVRALRERDPAGHRAALHGIAGAADALARAFRDGDALAAVDAVERGGEALRELAARSGAPLVPPALAAVAALARTHGGAAKPTGAGGGDLLLCAFPRGSAGATFRAEAAERGMTLVTADVDLQGVALADHPVSA